MLNTKWTYLFFIVVVLSITAQAVYSNHLKANLAIKCLETIEKMQANGAQGSDLPVCRVKS
jgi:hypothetical protein